MSTWPEFELERLAGALLRVELYEARYLAVREYHNVINHLLRSAAAACLLDQEDDARALIGRAAARMGEWVAAVGSGKLQAASFGDFAATRGMLAVALGSGPAEIVARSFAGQTAELPAGPAHNARLVAVSLLGNADVIQTTAQKIELSDAGLGLPWKRFALALAARDETAMRKALAMWVQEKMEATMTHEWGAYNEVPIEVSGALALAERVGAGFKLDSNRVFTRFRA